MIRLLFLFIIHKLLLLESRILIIIWLCKSSIIWIILICSHLGRESWGPCHLLIWFYWLICLLKLWLLILLKLVWIGRIYVHSVLFLLTWYLIPRIFSTMLHWCWNAIIIALKCAYLIFVYLFDHGIRRWHLMRIMLICLNILIIILKLEIFINGFLVITLCGIIFILLKWNFLITLLHVSIVILYSR